MANPRSQETQNQTTPDAVAKKEAYTRSSIVATLTVPPGGTSAVSQYGESFYLVSCACPVEIKTDLTPSKPHRKGTGEVFSPDLRFSRVEIFNPSDIDCRLQIWIGFGRYIDNRFEVLEGYSEIKSAAPAGSIPPNSEIVLNGIPSGNQIRRRNIAISNLDPTSPLVIKDEANNFICAVFPQTSLTLPIASYIRIVNTTGTAIPCYISETWYLENAF